MASSDSKSASKADLNESNMPLLTDVDHQNEKGGETSEKELIELKTENEKDDSNDTEKDKKGKAKKDKKAPKEPKPPKEKKPKGPGCIDTLSEGLNLTYRDGKAINTDINVDFDDVLAEPGSTQGFEGVWKVSYVLFTHTKLWLYRIFASILAIPAALIWALTFSILTVLYVWVLAPAFKLFDLGVEVARKIVHGVMRCTVEPVCFAIGAIFAQMNASRGPQAFIAQEV